MTTRYVIRPHGIRTTPRLLAEALSAKGTRRYPNYFGGRVKPSFQQDFFLVYPSMGELDLALASTGFATQYLAVRDFAAASKPSQRARLDSDGIPIPATAGDRATGGIVFGSDERGTKYVVRPLRHSGGQDYRVTSEWSDFSEGKEYVSRLFEKKHEYRVIFCLGVPIITLVKKVPEGTPVEAPWNHATGSRFMTVHQEENNRLRKTDVYDRLSAFPVVQNAHLVAADVLLRGKEYVIAELNFCPALTIPDNLQKVAHHVSLSRPE